MIKFAADENFNGKILRGLLRRDVEVDIVRVQDTALYKAEDPAVLAWAAREKRIVLTHDIRTMSIFAFQRIENQEPMPGLFQIEQSASVTQIIEDLILIIECSHENEWEGQIRYLPL